MKQTSADTNCPNCSQRGESNYGLIEEEFEEWSCKNDNCRVSIFKVYGLDY